MKKSELSYKMKKLLEPCKHWTDLYKKQFMPVVEYATGLEKQLKACEQELRQIRQVSLLDPPADKYQGRSSTLPEQEKTEYNIEHHAFLIVSQGNLNSVAGRTFMQRRNLSEQDVKTMARSYEKKLKKD